MVGRRWERAALQVHQRRWQWLTGGSVARGEGEGRRLNWPARPGDDGGVTQSRTTAHAGEGTWMDRRSEGGRPTVARRAWRGRRVAQRWSRHVVGRGTSRQVRGLGAGSASGEGGLGWRTGRERRGWAGARARRAALGVRDVVARAAPCPV
jgi:hypothetical protein